MENQVQQEYSILTLSALTRKVWIDGRELNIEKSLTLRQFSDSFNWGYSGSGSTQLALALAIEWFGEEESKNFIGDIDFILTRNFPSQSCTLRVNTEKLRNALKSASECEIRGKKSRYTHAFHFIDIKINDWWLPKFLDLPNFPYKSWRFAEGTIEHKFLQNLPKNRLSDLETYITANSVQNVKNSGEKPLKIEFKGQDEFGAYIFEGGSGSSNVTGHNLSEFYFNLEEQENDFNQSKID